MSVIAWGVDDKSRHTESSVWHVVLVFTTQRMHRHRIRKVNEKLFLVWDNNFDKYIKTNHNYVDISYFLNGPPYLSNFSYRSEILSYRPINFRTLSDNLCRCLTWWIWYLSIQIWVLYDNTLILTSKETRLHLEPSLWLFNPLTGTEISTGVIVTCGPFY